MYKIVLIFLMLGTVAACKNSIKEVENKDIKGPEGIKVPEERIYTEEELKIGKRICNALKSKRELFEKQNDQQQQIRFKGENRNCEQAVYNSSEFTAKVSNSSSNGLQYVGLNRTNYLSDVITDQSGVVKNICENLSVSSAVNNTILLNSSYMIVNLLIAGGYDRLEISKRSPDGSGKYPIVSLEAINIFTLSSQIDSKFFGLEQERIRYSVCSGSDKSSYIKQNWVANLTSF